VLLLALVIELRISGTSRRHFKAVGQMPNAIEVIGRVGAGFMTVALLVGEYQCARVIIDSPNSPNPWAPALGLGWGFATVAIAASLGARPRLIPTLEARPRPDKTNQFIVQIGASNEFGDKDVSPVMNLLIPVGVKIYISDQFGHVDPSKEIELLQTHEQIPPSADAEDWKYLFGRPLVSAGDAFVQHYVIILDDVAEARVVLRFDHVEFRRGRVQTQISLT
jgi:hypothetical protein